MRWYSAYGLTFSSALHFPGLFAPADSDSADFEIVVLPPAASSSGDPSAIRCIAASPSKALLSWGTVGDLVVEAGRSITVIPTPEVDDSTLALFVSGAGMGVLLHQRGLLVLHGSAIRVGEGTVGFLGAKGWGKSTMAMAMHRAGYPLVADEHLVVAFSEEGCPSVLPGTSPVKLWDDALAVVGEDADKSIQVRPGVNKYYSSSPLPETEQRPLQHLFLLDRGEQHAVEALSASSAFFGVAPHLYVHRFGTPFLMDTGATLVFRQLTEMVRKVPVSRLIRRPDLSQLPEIVNLVESSCIQ